VELILTVTGCALGGLARYFLMTWITRTRFTLLGVPWETLFVNFSGCLLLGALLGSGIAEEPSMRSWGFMLLGLCGGMTTFSTFSLQNLSLIAKGNWVAVAINCGLSITLCLTGALSGYLLTGGIV
jgi:CrcB protein